MKKPALTLEQADRVREVWAIFLEFTHGTLMMFFRSVIPESFLPYPKTTIEEALNIAEEYFQSEGQNDAAKAASLSLVTLMLYVPDPEALEKIADNLKKKDLVEGIQDSLDNQQKRNLDNLLQNY